MTLGYHILLDIQKDQPDMDPAFKKLVVSNQNGGTELSLFFFSKHIEILHLKKKVLNIQASFKRFKKKNAGARRGNSQPEWFNLELKLQLAHRLVDVDKCLRDAYQNTNRNSRQECRLLQQGQGLKWSLLHKAMALNDFTVS